MGSQFSLAAMLANTFISQTKGKKSSGSGERAAAQAANKKRQRAAIASELAAQAEQLAKTRTGSWSGGMESMQTFDPNAGRFLGATIKGRKGGRYNV